ncbi:MAG: hypothetical protein GY863_20025 [bacterium]|nr:hypothetical protein [bacterium]
MGFIEDRIERLAGELYNYTKFWLEKKENIEDAVKRLDLCLQLNPVYTVESAKNLAKAEQYDAALKIYGPDFIKDYLKYPRT